MKGARARIETTGHYREGSRHFHGEWISAYRDDMVAVTRSALDRWKPGEMLDVYEELLHLFVRIATMTLFGAETGGDRAGSGAERTLLDALNPTVKNKRNGNLMRA